MLAEPLNARVDNHERRRETCGLSVWRKCRQPEELVQAGVSRPQPHFWAPVMAVSLGMHFGGITQWMGVWTPLLQCLLQVTHPPQPSSPEPWMRCWPAPHPCVRAGPPAVCPSPAGLREALSLPALL